MSQPIREPENAPRISVVMPVYNAGALLDECLTALRASEGVHYEILIVDDSSTDGSVAIAERHGCRVLPSGGRLGPGGARNLGAREAAGEIVFFVDSDVVVRPDTLARLAAAFDEPSLDGVLAVQDPVMRHENLCSRYKNLWMYYTYTRRAGEDVPLFYTTAAAIRRQAFVDSGGFDLNYTNPNIEDTDYGQTLARMGYRVRVIPDLAVEHVKGYDLRGFLRTDYLRSVSLARLKLRKWKDAGSANDTSVPTGYIASVPLAMLALAALLLGVIFGSSTLLLANLVAFWAIILLNLPFIRILHTHGGLSTAVMGCGLLFVELLTAGAGSIVGVVTYFAGSKY